MLDTPVRRRLVVAGGIISAIVLIVVLVILPSGTDAEPQAGATPTVSTTEPAPTASPTTSDPAEPTADPAGPPADPAESSVPAPSPGMPSRLGTGKVVPAEPATTKDPVPLDQPGDLETGLTVRLSSIAAVDGKASAPGELAGPALTLTVVADNRADRSAELDGVAVLLYYGTERTPATPLRAGTQPLSGALASNNTRTGTYTFSVPEDQRNVIRIEMSQAGTPTVAFEGPVRR